MKIEEKIMILEIKIDKIIAYIKNLPIQSNLDLEDEIKASLENAGFEKVTNIG